MKDEEELMGRLSPTGGGFIDRLGSDVFATVCKSHQKNTDPAHKMDFILQ